MINFSSTFFHESTVNRNIQRKELNTSANDEIIIRITLENLNSKKLSCKRTYENIFMTKVIVDVLTMFRFP